MIRSATLKNFQSHARSDLTFHPGVNVIIGESDQGKSAIFRALNWVFSNRPSGEAFRSTWARGRGDETAVSIKLDDGTVGRVRTASKNIYCLAAERFNHGEGMDLAAIGRGEPPEEINALCNLGEFNIQGQHDSPFLLSESAAEVGRVLNRTVDLDLIDRALSRANGKIRALHQDRKRDEQELEQIDTQLEEFADLEAQENALREVEQAAELRSRLTAQLVELRGIVTDAGNLRKIVQICERKIRFEGRLLEIDDLMEQKVLLESDEIVLADLVRSYQSAKKNTDQPILAAATDVNVLLTTVRNLASLQMDRDTLREEVDRYKQTDTYIKKTILWLCDKEAEFHRLMPDKCPLCGMEQPHQRGRSE